ncbi:MAG TPA: D-aminoacyl-tRNA deacylase [Acidimicrobiales bacterium]|nr:D-aminoacyl-tRNA deacylase [Acidimicrobiales bacterium]
MRAIVQRVRRARVVVGDETVGAIEEEGLCVLVGVTHHDTTKTAQALAEKLWHLRVLPDEAGRMNRSCAELGAPLLVVSQFTLYADTSRGRRPSFVEAMPGTEAEDLVDEVVAALGRLGARVETGRFGAEMLVELVNDGPVTIPIEL